MNLAHTYTAHVIKVNLAIMYLCAYISATTDFFHRLTPLHKVRMLSTGKVVPCIQEMEVGRI